MIAGYPCDLREHPCNSLFLQHKCYLCIFWSSLYLVPVPPFVVEPFCIEPFCIESFFIESFFIESLFIEPSLFLP
jgi:hypothetical protein